jgi:hypothetical protein
VQLRDWMLVFLSLLLAFTLALAAPHFDYRYQLVMNEASAIRTTYLRAKGLPEPYQSHIAGSLKSYIDARLEFFSAGLDQSRINAAVASTKKVQDQIWSESARLAQTNPTPVTKGFIDSLTERPCSENQQDCEGKLPVVHPLAWLRSLVGSSRLRDALLHGCWRFFCLEPLTSVGLNGFINV